MRLQEIDIQSHHAYLLVGDRELLLEEVQRAIENALDSPTIGNPNVQIEELETFTVDDSRHLVERQLRKGVGYFVIAFDSITREAQNALLKVLEEPTDNTHIFLIVSQKDILLPTVLSRLFVMEGESVTTDSAEELAQAFLDGNPASRLKLVGPLVESKDKAEIGAFLRALEGQLSEDVAGNASMLKATLSAKQYVKDRGASVKLLLENLAVAS